jgi:hypothetical protein
LGERQAAPRPQHWRLWNPHRHSCRNRKPGRRHRGAVAGLFALDCLLRLPGSPTARSQPVSLGPPGPFLNRPDESPPHLFPLRGPSAGFVVIRCRSRSSRIHASAFWAAKLGVFVRSAKLLIHRRPARTSPGRTPLRRHLPTSRWSLSGHRIVHIGGSALWLGCLCRQ